VLGASDQHFGAKEHLILSGRASSMAEGWETRRRGGPGHDWAVMRLGAAGRVERVEVDTAHSKGNHPESAALEGCFAPGAALAELADASWQELLPRTKLHPHARHLFTRQLAERGPFADLLLPPVEEPPDHGPVRPQGLRAFREVEVALPTPVAEARADVGRGQQKRRSRTRNR
jgi:allantoicase